MMLTHQKWQEASLFEMMVGGERFLNAVILHDNERDAVGEGPIFVWALREQFDAAFQKITRCRQHSCPAVRPQVVEQTNKALSI